MSETQQDGKILYTEDIVSLVNGLSSTTFDPLKEVLKDSTLTKTDVSVSTTVETDSEQQAPSADDPTFYLPTSVDVKLPSITKTAKDFESLVKIPDKVPVIEGERVEIPRSLDGYREDEIRPHSLVISERNKALDMMDELLENLKAFEKELDDQIKATDVCPYQQTLNEFLGTGFVCPSIHDLPQPENYDAEASVRRIFEINERQHNLFLAQMEVLAAEAADTSFPGITSQHLNNAFASLSTTANGQEFVLDRQRFANHLEWLEIIRNLEVEDILKDPYIISQKLVDRFIEVHQ